jgi:hypothetical protein
MYDKIVKTVLTNYPRACIVMIDRITIPAVEAAYEARRAELQDPSEKEVWHGTRESSIEPICCNGFQPTRGRTMAFGDGIYFSNEFKLSWNYSPVEFRSTDLSHIFLCKILPGRVYQTSGHSGPIPAGYDSSTNGTNIFAIPRADQMKPEYLVRFHKLSESVNPVPQIAKPAEPTDWSEEFIQRKVAQMQRQTKARIARNINH